MKNVAFCLVAILAGLLLGGVSALWMSGLIGRGSAAGFADVRVEGWASDWSIGAASADAYTRARVARHGLLALSKEEAVYFTRGVDEDGRPLVERCTYALSGDAQDARWWSITLYDAESRLPMNDDEALSMDATQVGEGAWTATIVPDRPKAGHWLSSRNAGRFDLTLRLYQPASAVIADPERALVPPTVRRVGCGGGA